LRGRRRCDLGAPLSPYGKPLRTLDQPSARRCGYPDNRLRHDLCSKVGRGIASAPANFEIRYSLFEITVGRSKRKISNVESRMSNAGKRPAQSRWRKFALTGKHGKK